MNLRTRNFRSQARGVSLIELLLALSFFGFVSLALINFFNQTASSNKNFQDNLEAQSNGIELANYLLNLGRLADTCERPCSRTPLPANTNCQLQCTFRYADGSQSAVTFLSDISDNSTRLEESKALGPWVTTLTYPAKSVRGLEVCGDDEMAPPPGTCPIRKDPANQDLLERQYAMGSLNGRFFRFRIKVPGTINSADRFFTGAFYVRNPFGLIDARWPAPRVTKEQ